MCYRHSLVYVKKQTGFEFMNTPPAGWCALRELRDQKNWRQFSQTVYMKFTDFISLNAEKSVN